jgi:hypothetical protein
VKGVPCHVGFLLAVSSFSCILHLVDVEMIVAIRLKHVGDLFEEIFLAEQLDVDDEVVPIMVAILGNDACASGSAVALEVKVY